MTNEMKYVALIVGGSTGIGKEMARLLLFDTFPGSTPSPARRSGCKNLERAAQRFKAWKERHAPGHVAAMREFTKQMRSQNVAAAQGNLVAVSRVKARDRIISELRRLPEAEAVAHAAHLSLEVRGKRFGWYLENHHGDGRIALNCRSEIGEALENIHRDPERFHIPKYLGHRGWVGYWLDRPNPKWAEVSALLADAYCRAAPKSLVSLLFASRRDR